jgi:hypothetical protein
MADPVGADPSIGSAQSSIVVYYIEYWQVGIVFHGFLQSNWNPCAGTTLAPQSEKHDAIERCRPNVRSGPI